VALTREQAAALDAADPLAGFRERFVITRPELIYLDGNSLGRLPRAGRERAAGVLDEWSDRLVSGWDEWIDMPTRVGDLLAEGVLGARPGEVIVSDSTTVNLFKLCSAALDAYRLSAQGAVVTDGDNFPTDRYVLEGLAEQRGLTLRMIDRPEDLESALGDGTVALVVLSHVNYRTGALADMRDLTDVARRYDAHVVWDLCHSAGALPVDLRENGVELAVGCTYKYLNGGPGAPAFLYVRRDLQDELRSPIQGWFGQRDQFAMGAGYEPEDGIARFGAGTPPMLGLAAVEAAVELVGEAGIARIRAKAAALTDLAVALGDERLAPLGFELGSPRKAVLRGAHVSFRHRDAWRICQALIARANVVPDFRGPDSIRFGLPPLYTRFVDVWDAVDRTATLVAAGEHHDFPAELARVT
jgi:kynureninase